MTPEGAPIKLDFTNIPGREAIPSGSYKATIVKVESRKSQSSEFNYLNWELDLDHPDLEGRKLWYTTSLAPRALWKLREVLESLGFDAADLKGELTLDLDDFAGIEVLVEVEQEEWKGQDGKLDPPQIRNRVTMIRRQEKSKAFKSRPSSHAKKPSGSGRKVR